MANTGTRARARQTPAQADAPADAPAEQADQADDAAESTTPPAPDARDAEIARLRAELEKARNTGTLTTANADELPDSHLMVFADGTEVRTSSPVATHHTGDDGIAYPVVAVIELPKED